MVLTQWETLCGLFFAFFEKIVVPILTSGGLAAVTSSFFAALYSAFGKYDVVHIHAEGPAFFSWLPKMFGKRVVVTIHGIDWQREKWQSGLGSKFMWPRRYRIHLRSAEKHKTTKPPYSQPQILFNFPKPPSPRTCLIRKACIIQVQRKKRLVLEQSGSGDTER